MLSPKDLQQLLNEVKALDGNCALLTAFINKTLIYDQDRVARGDAIWQLRSAMAILSMQSGFALLETGCVKPKNVINIKVKNVMDVAMGGLAYWLFGYALSFGRPATWFCGYGGFAPNMIDFQSMGPLLTLYFYQFTLASSSTTIVSGACAERISIGAYMAYSFLNSITYCIPASWVWNKPYGFLQAVGYYDFAGTCVVHGNGGISALVAAVMIGPRLHRWENPKQFGMTSPVTALTGTLLLWWAWFAFNCGSTLGSIGEDGHLWKINALVAVNTLNGSVGGACFGLFISMLLKKGRVDVTWLISSILGGLVAITGICSVTSPLECLVIGAIGAAIAIATAPLLVYFKVDDPVGAVPVHFFASVWGTLSVGLFGKNDEFGTLGRDGLFHGGGFYLLGVQSLGLVCICCWSAITTFIFLFVIDRTIGIRMTAEEEEMGADICEHGIEKADGLRGMIPKEIEESALAKMLMSSMNGGSGRRRSTRKSLAILPGVPTFLEQNNRVDIVEEEVSGTEASFTSISNHTRDQNGTVSGAAAPRVTSAKGKQGGLPRLEAVRTKNPSLNVGLRFRSVRMRIPGTRRNSASSSTAQNQNRGTTTVNIDSKKTLAQQMALPNLPEVTH